MIITYREAAISDLNNFPRTQAEYNRCFPQRVTRHPGQPRAAETVFGIETSGNFQSIKTYNLEMMDFLSMKMNISFQLKWDCLGIFTHIHPKAVWRENLQDKIISELRLHMTIHDIQAALKTADGRESKEKFITLNFSKQCVQNLAGLIQTETIKIQTAPEIKEMMNTSLYKAAKKGKLPGRYYPYGISGIEEYRRVLN